MNKYSFSVKKMFGQIAGTYDMLNHLLSAGVDIYWRKKMVAGTLGVFKSYADQRPGTPVILDVAAGTGDVLIELIKTAGTAHGQRTSQGSSFSYICSDFSAPMLLIAREKIRRAFPKHIADNVSYVICDAQAPCFKDSSVDLITVAFGLRNFPDAGSFLEGAFKTLKTAGVLSILEFRNILKYKTAKIFAGYYNYFVTRLGKFFSGHVFAYSYLVESILAFQQDDELLARLEKNNFEVKKYNVLPPYLVSLYIAIINKNGR